MSGHSKWSTIKRAKAATDAKRGKIFSKISRELTIAAKMGGDDPDMNPRLRMVLLKAKSSNMPADNVARAVKKGVGGGEDTVFEDLTYEIYAANGIPILAEISTDNRNRTASDLRSTVKKSGGDLATAGAVSRLFERKGQIMIPRDAIGEDELMELALEAGADDIKVEDEGYEVLTDPGAFDVVHKAIDAKELKCDSAGLTFLPIEGMTAPITDASVAKSVTSLIDKLEDHDDVKDVYCAAAIEVDFEDEEG